MAPHVVVVVNVNAPSPVLFWAEVLSSLVVVGYWGCCVASASSLFKVLWCLPASSVTDRRSSSQLVHVAASSFDLMHFSDS